MSVRTEERRCGRRLAGSYPVVVRDRRGRVLARGRTGNVSQTGLYLLADRPRDIRPERTVLVEIVLPVLARHRLADGARRTVRYLGRVVRAEEVGQLIGVAIELGRKLP